jgi:hypothetical protein
MLLEFVILNEKFPAAPKSCLCVAGPDMLFSHIYHAYYVTGRPEKDLVYKGGQGQQKMRKLSVLKSFASQCVKFSGKKYDNVIMIT